MNVHVLLPGLTAPSWRFGGRLIAETFADLMSRHAQAQVVTYRDREEGIPFLDDVLPAAGPDDLFVVTWGPHVQGLLERLAGRRAIYYAQSTGWDLTLPEGVPVLCLSRHILAFWMLRAPHNPLFLLGPVLGAGCADLGLERDIDVLFLERKSTAYLQEILVPALQSRCNVHVVREFLPRGELIRLYNRSKVYLYSSAPTASGWVEGFGFQPLEAMVCGCTVFSNLHGGLADYLDPEVNAFKVETHSLAYDLERIEAAVRDSFRPEGVPELIRTYSEEAFHERIGRFLPVLEAFFAEAGSAPPDIDRLTAAAVPPSARSWLRRALELRKR
ncbi:MAG TPA: glycosyltransferase [Thermoanaerobaculia bacterium]|nr:glycosyltransferase [Thermoanaerobaculia bacterium]